MRIPLALAAVAIAAGCGAQARPVDTARLAAADRFAEMRVSSLTSLLVTRHGRIVFERYYHLGSRDQPLPVLSVTKSVLSTVVGIALGERRLRSLDVRLGDVLADEISETRPSIRSITLRQLLTMTSGFGSAPTSPFGDGGNAYRTAPDWVRAILAAPLARPPGSAFAYDNGNAHLVSAVLDRLTGESAADFARSHLFRPLGIAPPKWGSDRQGITDGAAGLWLRPRDLAKLGELYLDHGRWAGAQLVPADYVKEATSEQVSVGATAASLGYGYLWWTYRGNATTPPLALAIGSGGQLLILVPSRDAVIVMTSDAETTNPPAAELELAQRVLRAIRA